jgi:hypothetical protein
MDSRQPRSADSIFAQMHRELRSFNQEVPESAERLDPILRILMQMYAGQLASIDGKVGHTWEVARSSLIRSMAPECRRWPVPAFTVMRCQPSDPAVEVDPNTRFYYKEKREGGQTLFFSPLRTEKILAAEVKHIYLKSGNALSDLGPNRPEGSTPSMGSAELTEAGQLFVGVAYQGPSANLTDAVVFLDGDPEALKQLRWSHWYPGNHFGSFYEDSDICPGLGAGLEDIFAGNGQPLDWGGLRSTSDLFVPLADSFAVLPERFSSTWDPGPVADTVAALLQQHHLPPPVEDSLYWIRIDLPPGGDRSKLLKPLGIYFDCFVVVNKTELTSFKHTGGNRLVEVELPDDIATIFEITSVTDSNNRDYAPTHQVLSEEAQAPYSLEERDQRLALWFDFTAEIDSPPDAIKVLYTVTAGVDANGIAAGKIIELYENHPGIDSAANLIPTGGAIPAKTEEQIVSEASSRLRSRDRALTFAEIANWAQSFDPRITAARCDNGVQRFERGVRRCIVVTVVADKDDFHSEDETGLLKQRLAEFLKGRAPVNTQFAVEVDLK